MLGIVVHPKGQFSKIRCILKKICRIFAFVDTNAVLVRKIDKFIGEQKSLPCVKGGF